ncbi:MAG: hypothetical protein IJZ91_08625 [Oscillospiraceae bacterium]|nr:hypothetical protein [Oscillospiraceae bacterium]
MNTAKNRKTKADTSLRMGGAAGAGGIIGSSTFFDFVVVFLEVLLFPVFLAEDVLPPVFFAVLAFFVCAI